MKADSRKNGIIVSYKTYRKLIGIFGILLPLICVTGGLVGGNPIQNTISNYYYTNMRDFLVGALFCVSLFLITYRGYNRTDMTVSIASGLCAIGIAIFPCADNPDLVVPTGVFLINSDVSNAIHIVLSAIFFFLLAFNLLFLFTGTGATGSMTGRKIKRNVIYRTSGAIILVCLILAFIFNDGPVAQKYKLILIFETVGLTAFGISWLIKGEAMFKDKP